MFSPFSYFGNMFHRWTGSTSDSASDSASEVVPATPVISSDSGSTEMYQFIKDSCQQHLTIEDVMKLEVGDELDVVIWDGNFEEYWIWTNAESSVAYNPEEFFRCNHHQLTYLGDMTWDIHFSFGETTTHPIHLDVSQLETNYTWYPIDETDGKIHITNEIVNEGEEKPSHWKPKHLHWTEFPKTTRVGWRGPIMLWDKLTDHKLGLVHNKKGHYGEEQSK